MANEKIFETAKKQYNKMMNNFGLEHLTIGERLSEDTDSWNLRDMVSECQYQLDVCYEEGNSNSDGRSIDDYMDMYGASYEDALEEHKKWLSKTTRLRNFIKKFKRLALEIECTVGHCSELD